MRRVSCTCKYPAESGTTDLIIAKDGWPLELIDGYPFKNFLRRLFLGHHIECINCWEKRTGIKVSRSRTLDVSRLAAYQNGKQDALEDVMKILASAKYGIEAGSLSVTTIDDLINTIHARFFSGTGGNCSK